MAAPVNPKIYHICHVDRLPSVLAEDGLLCDAEATRRAMPGSTIGMKEIKERRLRASLTSHPGLHVGDCVPFYFCPRSVMLYLIHMANHEGLTYRSGQGPIIHLEADLRQTVAWAEQHDRRWAFTLSNAGARYFEDHSDPALLDEIDWDAVKARDWRLHKEGKQAEFLIEGRFSWALVARSGVLSQQTCRQVSEALSSAAHKPPVAVMPRWYY